MANAYRTESELDALRPLVDLQAVHVDVQAQTIYLDKAGMRIDVGGIGKGYAADQAVEALQRAGADSRSCGAIRRYQDIRPVAGWKEVSRRDSTPKKRWIGAGLD